MEGANATEMEVQIGFPTPNPPKYSSTSISYCASFKTPSCAAPLTHTQTRSGCTLCCGETIVCTHSRNPLIWISPHSARGKMVTQKFDVDLNKPLVCQVGHLGEAYEEWVHQPIISKEGPRFFESNFLEFFTRTAWWVIPVVWVPVASWFISNPVRMGLNCPHVALFVVLGIFFWTFAEYMLHRFLFHVKTKSYWGNTMHYLLHGCHHKHPMDGLRLVFPPAAAAILAIPIWNLVKLICTRSTAPAMFGGILLGYVMYDCTHYYLHHGQPKTEVPRNLKKYHLNHHYRIQNYGFGITSPLWDLVFGTVPPPSKVDAKRR